MRSHYADQHRPDEFSDKREEIVPRTLRQLLLSDAPQGRGRTRRRRHRKVMAVRKRR